jgi:hypothetical protein
MRVVRAGDDLAGQRDADEHYRPFSRCQADNGTDRWSDSRAIRQRVGISPLHHEEAPTDRRRY